MRGAWILTSDVQTDRWPDQTGDFGPPGASDADVIAALESGQPFRICYCGQPRYTGRVWPDASILAETFWTESGEWGVDPTVADEIEVGTPDGWLALHLYEVTAEGGTES